MKTNTIAFPAILLAIISIVACNESQHSTAQSEKKAMERGALIADSTQKVLAGNLKMAIQEGGLKNAIQYCNLQAMPLTQEMEEKFGASIKRTTTQVRNPKDAPTEAEQSLLAYYDSLHQAGAPMPPKTKWLDDKTIMYAQPIAINNALCLNCHGKVGEMVPDSFYAFIKEKYPDDQAINYEMGDLRGMWSIKFDKASLKKQ